MSSRDMDLYTRLDKNKVYIIIAAVLALPCAFGVLILWNRPGPVIHLSKQPAAITYDDGGPYVMRARESRGNRVEIWTGRESNMAQGFWEIEYGHSAEIHITGNDRTISKTNWKPDGIEVVFSSGHKHFIPKTSFTGGR